MIEERYVSAELAEMLREKCFDIPCRTFYTKYGDLRHSDGIFADFNSTQQEVTSAPTQQMVIDWLELKHNIFIAVAPRPTTMDYKRITAYVYKIKERGYSIISFIDAGSRRDAIDAAIKYSLGKII